MGNSIKKQIYSLYEKDHYTMDLKYEVKDNNVGISIGKALKQCQSLIILKLQIFGAQLLRKDDLISSNHQNCNKRIGPKGAQSIGDGLKYCYNLINLNIIIGENNNIGSVGAISLGNGIKFCTNLLSLSITINQNNNIGRDGATGIGDSLKFLFHLNSLSIDIQEDFIGPLGTKGLLEGLANDNNIQQLSLLFGQKNNIGPGGAKSIAAALKGSRKLRIFSLFIGKQNKIGVEGAREIGEQIQKCLQLESISLYLQNDIQKQGAKYLALGIQKNVNLKELEFTIQKEQEGGIDSDTQSLSEFGKNIQYLKQLKKIRITLGSNYQIGPEGVFGLAEGLKNSPVIQSISLAICIDNLIGLEGYIDLGEGFKNCKILKNLSVSVECNPQEIQYVISLVKILRECKCLSNFAVYVMNIKSKQRQEMHTTIQHIHNLANYKILDSPRLFF